MSADPQTDLVEFAISDAAALASLHGEAFPDGESWTELAMADLLKLGSTSGFGAMRKGELVSFLLAQCAADQAEILTIATAPDHRQRGHAHGLINQVEPILRARGAEHWLLEVAADNHGARAFYEKLGFAEDGRRPQYYKRLEGDRVDAILMSRPMGGQGTR